jgi:hypothetical protein
MRQSYTCSDILIINGQLGTKCLKEGDPSALNVYMINAIPYNLVNLSFRMEEIIEGVKFSMSYSSCILFKFSV